VVEGKKAKKCNRWMAQTAIKKKVSYPDSDAPHQKAEIGRAEKILGKRGPMVMVFSKNCSRKRLTLGPSGGKVRSGRLRIKGK